MFALRQVEYRTVAPLFAGIDHNAALVHAVIEGSSPGRVYRSGADQPACALVIMDGAFSYLGGETVNADECKALVGLLFDDLLPASAEKELVLFVFAEQSRQMLAPYMQERGVITIQRKVFSFDPERFALRSGWRTQIPQGMTLRAVDAELAQKRPDLVPRFEPESRRFGFCLLEEDKVVSLCSAVAVGGGEAEIDIFTCEEYRGRGLATLTASAFIEACIECGLTPAWSCWPYRAGSYALAKKLGFDERPDVPAFYWAEAM